MKSKYYFLRGDIVDNDKQTKKKHSSKRKEKFMSLISFTILKDFITTYAIVASPHFTTIAS